MAAARGSQPQQRTRATAKVAAPPQAASGAAVLSGASGDGANDGGSGDGGSNSRAWAAAAARAYPYLTQLSYLAFA